MAKKTSFLPKNSHIPDNFPCLNWHNKVTLNGIVQPSLFLSLHTGPSNRALFFANSAPPEKPQLKSVKIMKTSGV